MLKFGEKVLWLLFLQYCYFLKYYLRNVKCYYLLKQNDRYATNNQVADKQEQKQWDVKSSVTA